MDVVTKTFWGREIVVRFPDPVSVAIFEYGFIEEALTRIILRVVKEGMTVLDVGAHVGYYSLLFNHLAGPTGKVVAFEPGRRTSQLLRQNLRGTGVSTHSAALWSVDETVEFNDYGPALAPFSGLFAPRLDNEVSVESYPVPGRRLDSVVDELGIEPDLVKIDAESSEMHILHGMERTLLHVRPLLTLEVGDAEVEGASPSSEIISHLMNRGYEVFEFSGDKIVAHTPRDTYGHDNLLFVPRSQERPDSN